MPVSSSGQALQIVAIVTSRQADYPCAACPSASRAFWSSCRISKYSNVHRERNPGSYAGDARSGIDLLPIRQNAGGGHCLYSRWARACAVWARPELCTASAEKSRSRNPFRLSARASRNAGSRPPRTQFCFARTAPWVNGTSTIYRGQGRQDAVRTRLWLRRELLEQQHRQRHLQVAPSARMRITPGQTAPYLKLFEVDRKSFTRQ